MGFLDWLARRFRTGRAQHRRVEEAEIKASDAASRAQPVISRAQEIARKYKAMGDVLDR